MSEHVLMSISDNVSFGERPSAITLTWKSSKVVRRTLDTLTGPQEVTELEDVTETEEFQYEANESGVAERRRLLELYTPILYANS